jgi:hypothetical protein
MDNQLLMSTLGAVVVTALERQEFAPLRSFPDRSPDGSVGTSTLTALRPIQMPAPLLCADGRADVAEHLQRAIEAISADDPPHVRASAEKRANEAAYPVMISER